MNSARREVLLNQCRSGQSVIRGVIRSPISNTKREPRDLRELWELWDVTDTSHGSTRAHAHAHAHGRNNVKLRLRLPLFKLQLQRAVMFLLIISSWIYTSAAISISISTPSSTSTSGPVPIDSISSTVQVAAEIPFIQPTETETDTDDDQFATLLIDTRIPVFVDGYWQIMSHEEQHELRRRGPAPVKEEKEEEEEEETKTDATKTTKVVIDTSTITAMATEEASPLPSIFDGQLASNFSADNTCPDFINQFLSNETFNSCYSVALLFQGSQSFFQAEKSFFGITRVLDAACKADVDMCTDYFNNLAQELVSDGKCARDFKLQNALVVKAYLGMRTYNTVYKATCLLDADAKKAGKSPNYCFANAITNKSTASNSYLYYLPFNSSLRSSAAPACSSCTRDTMQIYQAATANRKAEITNTYLGAAEQINSICGPDFVGTSLAVAAPDSGALSRTTSPSLLLIFTLASMAISRWLL